MSYEDEVEQAWADWGTFDDDHYPDCYCCTCCGHTCYGDDDFEDTP